MQRDEAEPVEHSPAQATADREARELAATLAAPSTDAGAALVRPPEAFPKDAFETKSPSVMARLGTTLASPVGIIAAFPTLVVALGVFLTLVGGHSLRGSNLRVARERMAEQAHLVAASVTSALHQADPLLARLERVVREHPLAAPIEPLAQELANLLVARPGIVFVSISYPDGSYRAAYLEGGAVHIQDYRRLDDHTQARRYALSQDGGLTLTFDGRSDYDPRERPFYQRAVARKERTWTEPYSFYEGQNTGITRTEPLYVYDDKGERALYAVLTVDFDVHAMSAYLKERHLPGMRALLYQPEGTILAYTGPHTALPNQKDRALHYRDLQDPLLTAFFATFAESKTQQERVGTVRVGEELYLAAIAPVLHVPGLDWYVAYLAPEREFMHALHAYERKSFWIGLGALFLSGFLAYLFARHITRARAEVASAKALARAARKEARELGSYQLVACLGKGGMGEVWRAKHRLLAREAAIKLIKADGFIRDEGDRLARFRREAEALASLRSRHTIELFDYGVSEDGTFFIVTELLDGMDLETLVERYGPLPIGRVIHFLVQVCASLAEAHDAGLVHRDIKPANLFTCRAADEVDVIKVLDFGLVRATVDERVSFNPWFQEEDDREPGIYAPGLTRGDSVMGTPAFMAPEQALGQKVDGRTDLYALGAVAYYLLTGKLVFEAESTMSLVTAHIERDLPDLRARLPNDVPDEFVDLLVSCLAKSPFRRPADARTLAKALRAIPLAPHQEWNEQRAQAWWAAHHFTRPSPDNGSGPRALTVAMNLADK